MVRGGRARLRWREGAGEGVGEGHVGFVWSVIFL